jgi:aryl-alcohol dehydrogenase-like predicted oxidoreductase
MEQISPFRMAFGTMQFGGRADAAASAAMFDACLGAGVTHFDTACGYNGGTSEEILGKLAAPHDGRFYIATKVGYVGGAGRANMTAQFDGSRRRLGMDAVDLLYLHRYDPETPMEETLETFADFQSRGLIRHIGLSNFPAWAVMKAQAVAARMGTKIDAIQPMYNLVKRQAEVEILPMAADQGIAVYSYSPLGGGLLTGKYAGGDAGGNGGGRLAEDPRYCARYSTPAAHETAAGLARLAREVGIDAATLAVGWVTARGICPIVSARDAAQLAPSLGALNLVLPPDLLARITALSTTPPSATDRSEEA